MSLTPNQVRRFISPSFAGDASESRGSEDQDVPRAWIQVSEEGPTTELLPEECSTAWLMFAWQETFCSLVHLRTGRVFAWTKGEGLSLAAESFSAFLAQYADELWNGKRAIERDDSDEDEPVETRPWRWRD